MREDLIKRNLKVRTALFLCSVLAVSQPFSATAAGEMAIDDALSTGVTNVEQQNSVSGIVVDPSGKPVGGVTIIVDGTTRGAITDIAGKYSLNVKVGEVLNFSFFGYKTTEITVGNQSKIDVTLEEDALAVDEVVVVGYGTQKKSDITGSVTVVDKDRLSKLPVTNVLQAVQGAVAGVTVTQESSIPGDSPSVSIRGNNSLSASNSPYVVVDGIPISKNGGSLSDINPNDIESMQILKDASATAIYGTNGANGVILVTTKRGKAGDTTVRYSGYVGFEDFSHMLEMPSGAEVTQRYKDYVSQNSGKTMYNDYIMYENELENFQNGVEIDWIDAATQTGIIQNHNLAISGGAENVKYYVSADIMDQVGLIEGYQYKRYSYRTNLDVNVTDYMTIGTNSYIASHNSDGGRANLTMAEAMSPYAKMYDEDGSYTRYPMYTEQLWYNPMLDTTTDPERRNWNINMNAYGDLDFGKMWKPLVGLKYRFNGGYTFDQSRNSSYTGDSVYDANDGTASISNSETQSYTIENIMTYNRDFGKHHFDLTGLYAASRKKYQSAGATAYGFINDELLWYSMGSGETSSVSSSASLYTTISQMGRLNYNYDNRYLFTFTVRRDGSSVFGDNNKYGVFPSVAVGWNIAKESFMDNSSDWMNNLKLRLSVGQSGNEAISSYTSLTKLGSGKIAMGGVSQTYLYPSSIMGNADLSWETTLSYNVGVDFGFLNNRINGTIDAYISRTSDLLLARSLPKMSGYSTVYTNMGETQNKGIEFSINSTNIQTTDFTWSTSLNFSLNRDKIIDLYGDGEDDTANGWFLGQSTGAIYDFTYLGIWQTDEIEKGLNIGWDDAAQAGDVKLLDLNGDGKITSEGDKSIIGNSNADWIGGMTNTFSYKNLSLSIFIQTVQGTNSTNYTINCDGGDLGRRNFTSEVGYWTPENNSTEWRSLSATSNRYGYGYVLDNSYTRIKDITLSYNFSKRMTDMLHIGALTVYGSARNPFTFTNWVGWDPEARNHKRGVGYWEYNYPMTKTYVFGLNLTF